MTNDEDMRWRSLDWMARTCLPLWLEAAHQARYADALRELDRFTDAEALERQAARLWELVREAVYGRCSTGDVTSQMCVSYLTDHTLAMSGTASVGRLAPLVPSFRPYGWSIKTAAKTVICRLVMCATDTPRADVPAYKMRCAWDRVLPVVYMLRSTSPVELDEGALTTDQVVGRWLTSTVPPGRV